MQAGLFSLLLIGTIAAGVVGLGVAKPVLKDPKQQSLRHGTVGHHRSHSNFTGK